MQKAATVAAVTINENGNGDSRSDVNVSTAALTNTSSLLKNYKTKQGGVT